MKWAIAGRSLPKLTSLIEEIKELNVNRKPAGVIVADADDLDALTILAQSATVILSFAGPFAKFSILENTKLKLDWETKWSKHVQKMGLIMLISQERHHGKSFR